MESDAELWIIKSDLSFNSNNESGTISNDIPLGKRRKLEDSLSTLAEDVPVTDLTYEPLVPASPAPVLIKGELELLVHPPIDYEYEESQIPEELECVLCKWPLLRPFTHDCGNSFCEYCIKKSDCICPLCRGRTTESNLRKCNNTIVISFLDKLQVSCRHCKDRTKRNEFINHYNEKCTFTCPNNCGEEVTRKTLQDHWNLCPENIYSCPNKDCEFGGKKNQFYTHYDSCPHKVFPCRYCEKKFKQKDLSKHYTSCDDFPMKCPNGCQNSFPRKQQSHHFNQCSNMVIPCNAAPLGCTYQSQRLLMSDHLENCPLVKLFPYLENLEKRLSLLESISYHYDWKFLKSSCMVATLNDKRCTNSGRGIVSCGQIPSQGISEITFKVHNLMKGSAWNSFGLCSTESLSTLDSIRSTHYVGWTVGIRSIKDGMKWGLVAGYENCKDNIFYETIVGGAAVLPKIMVGDNIGLVFQGSSRSLYFKHNGFIQKDVYLKGIPSNINLHFAVAFYDTMEVTIINMI